MSVPHGKVVSTETAATPEVGTLTSLLTHPLLQDPKFVAAAGGLVVLLLFLSLFRSGKKTSRRSGPSTILLVGSSDGGKTSIFTKLVQGIYPQTHTSIQASSTTISFPSPDSDGQVKPIKLVDLPGHPRLRDELKKHVKDASGVVFVVDVQALVRNSASVAEELPPILIALSNLSTASSSYEPIKFLILAHKSDLLVRPSPPTTRSPPDIPEASLTTARERVKSILTRELDRLKSSRGGSGGKIEGMGKVAGTSNAGFFSKILGFGGGSVDVGGQGDEGEDESLIWGGKGPFKWEDVEGVEIEWGASGLGVVSNGPNDQEKGEGNGLDELRRFIWEV
ncbi:uncharacterized protein IL334_003917 [Kwoniella shivajii]|uniref:Signal recognition particle receptor subunit beta n=1 Tax=Kwoniella shivajii TaxID=564305 RepID=A0ABZ1CYY0_9TREE|nr:hypothetical protein IL334_003917 [Kwoniella shivajii]